MSDDLCKGNSSSKNVCIDIGLMVASLLVAIGGWCSVYHNSQCAAWLSIGATDLYLFAVILIAAVRADKEKNTYKSGWELPWLFPSRRAGVITIPLMAFALVLSFAGLFWALSGNCNFTIAFSNQKDAVYFSLVTLTTVGYGDIAPVSEQARDLVILEIGSGFLVLIGAFPLLISRVSQF